MTAIQLEGGCLCGAIRYEISDQPISSAICHCRSCQRAAGAESVAWAVCARTSFRWLGSEPEQYGSSDGVTRTFCGKCGTTLTYQCSDKSIDVTLATLDDPERLAPTREVWLRHRISWSATNPSLTGYDEFSV